MNAIPESNLPSLRPLKGTLKRSAVVGVVATVVDLLMLWLLIGGAHVSPALANVPALSLGLLIQFIGNKYWAFRDHSDRIGRQGAAFLLVEIVAFALNAGFFHILAVGLAVTPLLARVIASAVVYFGFSYRFWGQIFHPTAPPTARA
jgi:putative flippase GtrA